jgi:hypothetical protein
MIRAIVLAGLLACLLAGCGSDDDGAGTSLVGSWLLYSIQVDTTAPAVCPAEIDLGGGYVLVCGADDTLTLAADGTYASTLDQIPTAGGVWNTLTLDGQAVIVFEDQDDEDDPQSYVYELAGDTLTISKSAFDRDAVLVFERL